MNLKRVCSTLITITALTAALSFSSFAFSAQGGKVTANGSLNMRSQASLSASVITKLPTGSKVLVLDDVGDWYKVAYQGTVGFVSDDYLSLSSAMNLQAGYAEVTANSGLRLRSGPNTSYTILTTLPYGATAEIIGVNNGWVKVNYKSYTGYLSAEYIAISSNTSPSGLKVISSTRLRMRSGPGTGYSIITNLAPGTIVKKLGVYGSWYQVQHGSYIGYISGSYVTSANYTETTVSADKIREGVVAYAKTFLGTKYVYGGNTPETGFDCSGFVKYVLAEYGYSVPRTSATQYSATARINKSQLKLGDLIFFGSSGTVSHVGMYIGENKFIHAENSKTGVCISSLSSSYYTSHYIGCGRVIG